jgi:outer membrane receptor protein involved in Fe transport
MRRALALLVALAWSGPVLAQDAPPPATGGEAAKDDEKKPAEPVPSFGTKSADAEAEELVGPIYSEVMLVTASRIEESVADAPVSVTVIREEQIESSPATNYGDLLRGVPGLNVVQVSARDLNFVARGAASTLATSQLALVDGRSIYQDFYGFVMWDVLPMSLDEVKQIEVLRGPGSAIWGANALAGVVNVRTKSPREILGGVLMAGAGEQSVREGYLRWADARDKLAYKLSASWFEQGPWPRATTLPDGTPLPAEAIFANEGSEQPKLDLRFDWDVAEGRRWSYQAGYAGTTGIMHTGIGPFRIDSGTYQSYGEVAYAGKEVDAKFYLNWLDGDATNLLNALPFAFETRTWVGDVAARHVASDRHLLVYGGTARLNRFDLSIAPRDDARDEVGAFLEDQMQLGDEVSLSIGARFDWFDTIGLTASPRTSVIWKPVPEHALRFAYNRAFRSPSLVNNYLDTAVPNAVVLIPGTPPFVFLTGAVGNEDLSEETVDAFELSWTGSFARKTTMTAAVYRNETKDTIDFYPAEYYSASDPPAGWPLPPSFVPPDTLPKLFTYRNIGSIVDRGLELSLDTRWNEHVWTTASYTYQDEPEASGEGSGQPLVVNVPPRHMASFLIGWNRGRFTGSAGVTFTDEALWTDVLDQRFWGETDSYELLNASFGVKWEHVELAVSGTNLADEDARQHVFGDVVGRLLRAEVRWRF